MTDSTTTEERRGADAYVAELIGTFLLVLFIGMVLSLHNAAGIGVTDWAVIGLLHLFVLAVLLRTLGGVSGGHFNPAVTVTFAMLRRIAPIDAAIYVVLQLLGALVGALVVKLLLENEGDPVGYGAPVLSPLIDGKALSGFACELIGTFVLVWAYLHATTGSGTVRARARTVPDPFVAAGALAAGVFVFGPLTGGALNPARAFGPSLVGGGESVGTFLLVYVLGPLVGAVLAGFATTALTLAPKRAGEPPAAAVASPGGGEILLDTTRPPDRDDPS